MALLLILLLVLLYVLFNAMLDCKFDELCSVAFPVVAPSDLLALRCRWRWLCSWEALFLLLLLLLLLSTPSWRLRRWCDRWRELACYSSYGLCCFDSDMACGNAWPSTLMSLLVRLLLFILFGIIDMGVFIIIMDIIICCCCCWAKEVGERGGVDRFAAAAAEVLLGILASWAGNKGGIRLALVIAMLIRLCGMKPGLAQLPIIASNCCCHARRSWVNWVIYGSVSVVVSAQHYQKNLFEPVSNSQAFQENPNRRRSAQSVKNISARIQPGNLCGGSAGR